jgi:hypothetical protein
VRPARTGASWARGYLATVVDANSDDDSMPGLQEQAAPREHNSSDANDSVPDLGTNTVFCQVAYLAVPCPGDVAMNAMLQPNKMLSDQPNCSLLQDSLIDAGESSHVTNNCANLALNVEEHDAVMLQVADGVLIRAKLCGTV